MKPNIGILWLWPALASYLCLMLALANAQTFTTLHNFDLYTEGGRPVASLTLLSNTLYGAAESGGTSNSGTIFAINTDGANFRLLHAFSTHSGITDHFYNSDGVIPASEILSTGDVLYGTTRSGGTNGSGTIFAVPITGIGITNLHTFTDGNDGGEVFAGLILSSNTLYGATAGGGSSGNGTIFSINSDGTDFTNLHSFPPILYDGFFTNSDGEEPLANLTLSGNALYGVAMAGGANGAGTVFAVSTDGTVFTVLHAFVGSDGFYPIASLILSGNILYGTTSEGGTNDGGTVFAVNADGTGFTNLYKFTGRDDGAYPAAGLILSGNTLFGVTADGGVNDNGTIFCVHTDGTGYVNLHSFSAGTGQYAFTNSDGANPVGGLVMSRNILYGTAEWGGTNGFGTIFSLTLPPPPPLNITLAETNVILTWPTNAIIYTLQSATNLVPPVVWNPVSPSPAIGNGQNTVTNPLAATQMFYRLSQ